MKISPTSRQWLVERADSSYIIDCLKKCMVERQNLNFAGIR